MRLIIILVAAAALCAAQSYDIVLHGGRVIDPESGLDAVRDVAINGGKIRAISSKPLAGRRVIDAKNLVIAPGFIDLHWQGRDPGSDLYEAMDGVTASFELGIGVPDVDEHYKSIEGKSAIHHGAAVGHPGVRMKVLGDTGEFLPADRAISTAVDGRTTPFAVDGRFRIADPEI